MALDLSKLVTEGRLPESVNIDQATTLDMLRTINDQVRAGTVGRRKL
jgi:N-acetylmuramic acid 6-phosphate (MurNAc-6-P) etherase